MTNPTIRFDASAYVRSHGKMPRGRGYWAFKFGSKVYHAPGEKSLSEAKDWLRQLAQSITNMPRFVVVDVMP
jgi:hypothetical protein